MRPALATVYLKELKDALRDRRTALMIFLASVITGPLTLVLVAQFISGLEEKAATLKVRMAGQKNAPALVNFLQRNDVEIEAAPSDYEGRVREGRLDAVIVIPDDFDERFLAGDHAKVEIVYDDSRTESGPAIRQAERLLRAFNRETGTLRMMARGVSPDLVEPVKVDHVSTATARQKGAFILFLIPMFAILSPLLGGMTVAIDSTAGERERQSLEPLLANPVPRDRILLGKLLATASFSSASLTLGLLAFLGVGHFMPTEQLGMSLALGPHFFAIALPVLVPLVLLLCIGQILIAAFARSVREAQTYLGLAQLVPLIPSIVLSVLPVKAQLWMYAVPLLGQQLTIMRLLRAEPVPALALSLSALVTLLAATAVFLLTRRVYDSERLAIAT